MLRTKTSDAADAYWEVREVDQFTRKNTKQVQVECDRRENHCKIRASARASLAPEVR